MRLFGTDQAWVCMASGVFWLCDAADVDKMGIVLGLIDPH